tara:strand:+ start:1411 stop:1746 length:336 start_codon:yes stop_codon:yes gene_type:complete
MKYLYFKQDGRLHIKSKIADLELAAEFPNPIAVADDYVSTVADGVAEEEGMPAPVREKTKSEIEAEITYAERRAEAYPSIEDQLDNIYHHGIDAWKAGIKAIKDANPKENN